MRLASQLFLASDRRRRTIVNLRSCKGLSFRSGSELAHRFHRLTHR